MSTARAFVEAMLAAVPLEPVELPAAVDLEAVVGEAAALGIRTARLVGPRSKIAILDTLATDLHLPSWFGRNWDALEEVLGAPEPELAGPLLVVWEGWPALAAADPRAWSMAREVLRDAAAARRSGGAGPLLVLLAGAGPSAAGPSGPERGAPMTATLPPHIRSVGRVHHVALIVRAMDAALAFYRDTLGLAPGPVVPIPSDRVKIAFLPVGEVKIELVEPTDDSTGVARFLASRGEGFHHVCFEVPDVSAALTRLGLDGVELIDTAPRPGAEGPVAFLHPRSCHGVLVELIEAPGGPAWGSLYPHGFRAPGAPAAGG
jgi:methylmalonyl-CoA/ethylmalonyl-CoA epimerase